MTTQNRTNTFLRFAAIAMATIMLSASSSNAQLIGELAILDLTANGGINPATGAAWQAGDTYRLGFVSSTTRNATSTDINDYNNFVQSVANASPLNLSGANWNVIASTEEVNARVNTSTQGDDGEAIFKMDGASIVAVNYGDLWNGLSFANPNEVIDLDETGTFLDTFVFAGTSPSGATITDRWLGTTTISNNAIRVERGDTTPNTTGRWIQQFNDNPNTLRSFYALSDPLAIVPEPSAIMLAAIGFVCVAWYAWRRKR